jgi:hypothetical protein
MCAREASSVRARQQKGFSRPLPQALKGAVSLEVMKLGVTKHYEARQAEGVLPVHLMTEAHRRCLLPDPFLHEVFSHPPALPQHIVPVAASPVGLDSWEVVAALQQLPEGLQHGEEREKGATRGRGCREGEKAKRTR